MKQAPDNKAVAEAPAVPDWVRAKIEKMLNTPGQCRRTPRPTVEEIAVVVEYLFKNPTPIPDPIGGGAWSLNAFDDVVYIDAPRRR